MVTVKFADLLYGFEFASSGNSLDDCAFISLNTGAIHFVSSELDLEEETPEDIDDETKYLAIPHKNDLDLGRSLVLSFIEEVLPNDYDKVVGFFHKRGAYSRFRDLLETRGIIDQWYKFESTATETALRQWCKENDIQLTS